MTGWQRFFLLLMICAIVLLFWPQYDQEGLVFMGAAGVLWICLIILFSVLINIFAIYKLEILHRLLSIIFLGAMGLSFLYYFPLPGGDTPMARMKRNVWPTKQDLQEGINRLTFHVDFINKNVRQDADYINQQLDHASGAAQKIKKTVQQQKEKLEIIIEDAEGEE